MLYKFFMRLVIFFLIVSYGFNAFAKVSCERVVTDTPLAMIIGEMLMKQKVKEMVIGRHTVEATGKVYSPDLSITLNRTAKVKIEAEKWTKRLEITVKLSSKVRGPLDLNFQTEREYLIRDSLRVAAAMSEYVTLANIHRSESTGNPIEITPAVQTRLKDGHAQWDMELTYHQSADESDTEALQFVSKLISGVWHKHQAE